MIYLSRMTKFSAANTSYAFMGCRLSLVTRLFKGFMIVSRAPDWLDIGKEDVYASIKYY